MAVLHDYRCRSCGFAFEAFVEAEQRVVGCVRCDGAADRIYLHFGTMIGKNKGVYPRFDTQLGCTLESAQHMEEVAKSRGLIPMGNEEWNRSRNAPRTPNPMDSDEPDPQLIEIAKKAWDDVKYQRVPIETEVERVKDVVEADILDVKDAPKSVA